MKVKVITRILEANDRIAAENRKLFNKAGVYVINLMSAPGAGKTSLIERTITELHRKLRIGVIEGDIAGTGDAQRIEKLGIPVIQINTGSACHLDANMINEAIVDLPLKDLDLLVPELLFVCLQNLFENDVDAVCFYNRGIDIDKIQKAVQDRIDLFDIFRNHLLRILSEFRIFGSID